MEKALAWVWVRVKMYRLVRWMLEAWLWVRVNRWRELAVTETPTDETLRSPQTIYPVRRNRV